MRMLFVVSRDPNEYKGVEFVSDAAKSLAEKGNEVHLYLIENGVFMGKVGANTPLAALTKSGVKVYAEDVSLQVRGLQGKTLPEIKVSNMDELVDLIMEKTDKVMWY